MATTLGETNRPDTSTPVRVLIADDDLEVRVLLRVWLERHGSFEVAGEAVDGLQAVEVVRRDRPELVVLDLAMPRMDGLEAAAEIRRLDPDVRIVIHSAFSAARMAQQAIDAGADVYVEKSGGRAGLIGVLEGLIPARRGAAARVTPEVGEARAADESPLDALLLDALDEGVLLVDGDARVRSASFAASVVLGVPTSRLVGSSLADLLAGARHGDARTPLAAGSDPVSAVLATGRPRSGVVLHLVRPDGADAWLSFNVRAVLGAQGSAPTGAVVVVSDLTEDHRLREALREAEAWQGLSDAADLLEAAVVSSPVGALLLDASADLVIANPVADRLLGGTGLLGADPPVRRLLWADTREPVRDEDLPVRAACEGTPFDDVEVLVAGEDRIAADTFLKLSGRPVLGPQGRPAGAVISVLDDTAAQAARRAIAAIHEELQRSNLELANFASTASHDLSQPLMKIQGYAEMLQELELQDPRARDYVERILAGTERMRAFIRDLLSLSQVTSGGRSLESIELAPLVQEVVELFEQEITDKGATLDVGPLPTVVADPMQLSHLFQNLIGNALTYVAEGVSPVIGVTSTRQGEEWVVTVTDNGIGISPEDRDRAFAMFERLVSSDEYAGTGIGLAMCAKIVERLGGRIWIEGEPGRGTSICFTIPDRPREAW